MNAIQRQYCLAKARLDVAHTDEECELSVPLYRKALRDLLNWSKSQVMPLAVRSGKQAEIEYLYANAFKFARIQHKLIDAALRLEAK